VTVYYSQKDPRWANLPYTKRNDPKQTIATSACGPTSFAMVASTFLGRAILPPEAAKYALDKGFRTDNSGTDWGYFRSIVLDKVYGLECKQTGIWEEVKRALSTGALVIASMAPGHLTGGGHYVLLVGIGGKWIDVHDPNHTYKYPADGLVDRLKGDGKIKVDELVFKREARQYWIFPQPVKIEEDEAMTATERKEFDLLGKKVDELTSLVTTLTMKVAAAQEAVSAPKWFETEFGNTVLSKMSDPTGTTDFWRSLAVSLRMQGLGKGKK